MTAQAIGQTVGGRVLGLAMVNMIGRQEKTAQQNCEQDNADDGRGRNLHPGTIPSPKEIRK